MKALKLDAELHIFKIATRKMLRNFVQKQFLEVVPISFEDISKLWFRCPISDLDSKPQIPV